MLYMRSCFHHFGGGGWRLFLDFAINPTIPMTTTSMREVFFLISDNLPPHVGSSIPCFVTLSLFPLFQFSTFAISIYLMCYSQANWECWWFLLLFEYKSPRRTLNNKFLKSSSTNSCPKDARTHDGEDWSDLFERRSADNYYYCFIVGCKNCIIHVLALCLHSLFILDSKEKLKLGKNLFSWSSTFILVPVLPFFSSVVYIALVNSPLVGFLLAERKK